MRCRNLTCLVVGAVLTIGLVALPVATGYAQTKSSEATLDIGLLFGLTGFISSRDLPDYNETLIAADVLNEGAELPSRVRSTSQGGPRGH